MNVGVGTLQIATCCVKRRFLCCDSGECGDGDFGRRVKLEFSYIISFLVFTRPTFVGRIPPAHEVGSRMKPQLTKTHEMVRKTDISKEC